MDTTPTNALLSELHREVEKVNDDGNLTAYAANAALRVLLSNWEDALGDNHPPETLLLDIGKVNERLQAFQEVAQHIACAHRSTANPKSGNG
jgi:hypothetical protein